MCLLLVILTQTRTPPKELTRAQQVQTGLIEVCRDMTVMLYPQLSDDQITTACFQETAELYQNHPEEATYCYDTVKSEDLMEWFDCFTEHDLDFTGKYVDQVRVGS